MLLLIKQLRERGLGVMVISHNLADVFEVADRVFVLRLGRPAGTFDVARTNQDEVVAAITGAHLRPDAVAEQGGRTSVPIQRRHRPAPAGPRRSPLAAARRVFGGDLVSVRVIVAIAVIWIIFQSQNDRFLSAVNLTNLMLQITATGLISVGVVFVLLLGEIDLSVGAVSGVTSALMAVMNVQHGWNRIWPSPPGWRWALRSACFRDRCSPRSASRRSSSRSPACSRGGAPVVHPR